MTTGELRNKINGIGLTIHSGGIVSSAADNWILYKDQYNEVRGSA